MLISILSSSPNLISGLLIFSVVIGVLIISLSIHEFAHAYVANLLGDDTAKIMGRVTLNPKAHIDPTGLLLLIFVGFGWGKPVPVNSINLDNPKRDTALISLAGPLSNILLGFFFAILYHTFGEFLGISGIILILIRLIVSYNVIFAVFNLLPIHPLDGFKIVNGLLSEELSYQWIQMGQYGIWILLLLFITDTIGNIVTPISNLILQIFGI